MSPILAYHPPTKPMSRRRWNTGRSRRRGHATTTARVSTTPSWTTRKKRSPNGRTPDTRCETPYWLSRLGLHTPRIQSPFARSAGGQGPKSSSPIPAPTSRRWIACGIAERWRYTRSCPGWTVARPKSPSGSTRTIGGAVVARWCWTRGRWMFLWRVWPCASWSGKRGRGRMRLVSFPVTVLVTVPVSSGWGTERVQEIPGR